MWVPTHVQVTVQRAVNLLTKGKNNTNDCFVTIGLGKIKYQTSVKEKASGSSVEWHEECELPIPDQGNTAEIVLTVLHHNFLGVDEFLGRTTIPLNTLDIYERPKNKLYVLQAKPGGKLKDRGQLEVKIAFNVKSGSLTSLNKKEKHRSSLTHVAQSIGGSLLSLGTVEKRKGIKRFAKSIGSKMHLKGKKKDELDDGASIGSVGSLNIRSQTLNRKFDSKQTLEDADPGVVSDEDEFTFDDLSHKSSTSSISISANTNTSPSGTKTIPPENVATNNSPVHVIITKSQTLPPAKPPRSEPKPPQDEWETKLFGNAKPKSSIRHGSSESLNRRSWDSSKLVSQIVEESELLDNSRNEDNISIKSTPEIIKTEDKDYSMLHKLKNNFRRDKDKSDLREKHEKIIRNSHERIIIGGEREVRSENLSNHLSNEILQKFDGKSREELILALIDTQSDLEKHKKKLKDLEDYLDDLLLRVMETTPRILQNPYISYKLSKQYS